MRTLAILGATGSIGTQALDLVARHEHAFRASVLTAHSNAGALFEAARRFKPDACGLVMEPDAIPDDLKHIDWYFGESASVRALEAVRPDDALAAVVGIAGLPAVMAALTVCRRVLLANKEALVTAGDLVLRRARETGAMLLPVDSEHSAIFQCLEGANGNSPARLILTASGGALRDFTAAEMARATAADVLRHPTWSMGAKITVDCATMMNKGLEVIEAHHLFQVPMDRIDVVIHPQSVIHSMVEYEDGAVLAQLGAPDMRGAIGYAMGYPARLPFDAKRLNFAELKTLTFEAPDARKYPLLHVARAAQAAGGAMPVAMNGANEAAVAAFLGGRIPFGAIAELVSRVLDETEPGAVRSVEDVQSADHIARERAARAIFKAAP